jgi:mono/diheme cytochrome c family protein
VRELTAFVLSAIAIVSVAGCAGGGSDDRLSTGDYRREVVPILGDFFDSLQELGEAAVKNDIDGTAALADRLGDNADELAARLDALSPPEELEATHDKLASGLEKLAGWAHELADRINAASTSDLADALEEFGLAGGLDSERISGLSEIGEATAELQTDTRDPIGEGDPVAGKARFLSNGCGSCHTLFDAESTATVGPDLDAAQPSYSLVVERVTNGKGAMPAFSDSMSEQDIKDVAAYVSCGSLACAPG